MTDTQTEGLFPGELARGLLVAGYKVRQRIGGGATGTVYAAVHPQSGRKVAIKLLHPHLAQRPESLRLFEEQSRRLAGLRHPGIIPLLEVGRLADAQVYLISEFALGQPLTDLLATSGALEVEAAHPLIDALAMVLEAAHRQQVVHGDLTLDNVWITPQDSGQWPPLVRVMDFGMGLLRGSEVSDHRWREEIPYYLSPEQCRGGAPQVAADIYALGVIAYQMLTGRLPFSSSKPTEVVRMHLEDAPRPPSSLVTLPGAVDELLLRALAKRPEDRFRSMAELRDHLRGGPEPAPEPPGHLPAVEQPVPELHDRPPAALPPAENAIITLDAEPPRPYVVEETPLAAPPRPYHTTDDVTGELPPPARRRTAGNLLSAGLGLLLAAAAVLIGHQLLVGRLPWESKAAHPEGVLHVASDPPAAKVFLNDVAQPGRTPLSIPHLLRGQPYQLALELPGFRRWQQPVALGLAEEERLLKIQLSEGPASYGSLHLSASQRADFFLGDRKVGTQTTSLTLAEVRAGLDHELRVVAPGFTEVRQKIRVEAGKTQVLHFDLETAR